MAASTLSLALTPSPSDPSLPSSRHRSLLFLSPLNHNHHFLLSHRSRFRLSPQSSCSSASSSESPLCLAGESTSSSASAAYSRLEDWLKTGNYNFLSNEELLKLQSLQDFRYRRELRTGSLCIRVMRPDETDVTVKLLSESFVESMMLPDWYLPLISYLVKQYLMERRAAIPHAVTLLGFVKWKDGGSGGEGEDDEEGELAGTVEICFHKRGANDSPPTPTAPKDSPYICNMTVNKPLRRRGVGWNLLKASEELISQMSFVREVYLHCRMVDSAPFNMYMRAGYNVVKTDGILVLLLLQSRKHLMLKKLPLPTNNVELDMPGSDPEHVQVGA
ncbi:unnamed protein product [Linum tenue]|uniref:N-acetyltransferase domain-containing protein n=2 Tax=Linum tenue TaxID=586396 RepID=A0AAV0HPV6_9ROSI|nr:unnamed protein product [Linum tenue]